MWLLQPLSSETGTAVARVGEELQRPEAATCLKEFVIACPLISIALGVLEVVYLVEIFWQLLKIPAREETLPTQEAAF